jgi:hypothetical protein
MTEGNILYFARFPIDTEKKKRKEHRPWCKISSLIPKTWGLNLWKLKWVSVQFKTKMSICSPISWQEQGRKIIVFEIIRDMMNPNCTSIVWTLFNRTLVWLVGFMVFNATFNIISVISWWSSEWVFSLKPKWAFVHLYHGKNKVHLDEMNLISTLF